MTAGPIDSTGRRLRGLSPGERTFTSTEAGGTLEIDHPAPGQPRAYYFTLPGQSVRLRGESDGWHLVALVPA